MSNYALAAGTVIEVPAGAHFKTADGQTWKLTRPCRFQTSSPAEAIIDGTTMALAADVGATNVDGFTAVATSASGGSFSRPQAGLAVTLPAGQPILLDLPATQSWLSKNWKWLALGTVAAGTAGFGLWWWLKNRESAPSATAGLLGSGTYLDDDFSGSGSNCGCGG